MSEGILSLPQKFGCCFDFIETLSFYFEKEVDLLKEMNLIKEDNLRLRFEKEKTT